jgi:hypothetical protein
MIGMPEGAGMPGADASEMTDAPPPPADGQAPAPEPEKKKKKSWNPLDVVKDVVDKIP